jgi:hypothetical protein
MFDLSNYPLAVIFLSGLASILAASEIGWQLGIRTKVRAGGNLHVGERHAWAAGTDARLYILDGPVAFRGSPRCSAE